MAGHHDRRMHESTSRWLSRVAFVVLGALPLALCLSFCVLQYLPSFHQWRVERWQTRLTALLGLAVEIASVEELSPTQTRLCGVRFRHPESKVEIGNVHQVVVDRYLELCRIHVDQLVIEGSTLNLGWRLLHDFVLCRPDHTRLAMQLTADRLTIHGPESSSVSDILINLWPGIDATQIGIDFLPTERMIEEPDRSSSLQPIRVSLKRHHAEGDQRTDVQLRALTTPLPCSLVKWIWPAASDFGIQAKIQGVVDLSCTEAGWNLGVGRWSGGDPPPAQRSPPVRISGVDFRRLFSLEASSSGEESSGKTHFAGTGTLWLQRAEVTERRIEYLWGVADIDSGSVSTRFLQTCSQQLGILLVDELMRPARLEVAFGKAQIHFCVDASTKSLHLAGALPGGGLVQGASGNLASRSNWEQPIPLERLASVLQLSASDSSEFLRETDERSDAYANSGEKASRLADLTMRWLSLRDDVSLQPKSRSAGNDRRTGLISRP